jgi:hypothetical protein
MPKGDPKRDYKPPVFWDHEKYTEVVYKVLPKSGADWQFLNRIVEQELTAGRAVVIVPPRRSKR